MAGLVLPYLVGKGRTGPTDNAHLAARHVKELMQFVQRILAQKPTESCDARVVGDLKQHTVPLVQVHDLGAPHFGVAQHGTKLYAAKCSARLADALRRIEHRPRRIQLDGVIEQLRNDDQDCAGEHNDDCALEKRGELSLNATLLSV